MIARLQRNKRSVENVRHLLYLTMLLLKRKEAKLSPKFFKVIERGGEEDR
jgi:hypothetical protein